MVPFAIPLRKLLSTDLKFTSVTIHSIDTPSTGKQEANEMLNETFHDRDIIFSSLIISDFTLRASLTHSRNNKILNVIFNCSKALRHVSGITCTNPEEIFLRA